MAIHGPRKDVHRGRRKEQSFYDTLTVKQKEHWKQLLKLMLSDMGGYAAVVDCLPESSLRKAIDGLHSRLMKE